MKLNKLTIAFIVLLPLDALLMGTASTIVNSLLMETETGQPVNQSEARWNR